MKTTKRIFLIATAAALAIFSLGCSFNVTTAKIDDAIMTTNLDDNGAPVDEVVSYPTDAAMLYTSAKILNAPDNTQIRIVWTYVTGDQKMDEITLDSGTLSDRYIYSSFEPTAALPEGDYQVEYFVEDRTEADATVKFVVVAAESKPVASTDGAYVEDVHMTSMIDESGLPVDTITSVGATGTWYVSAILRNTQADTIIHYVWYDTNGEVIDSYDFDPQGATDVYISGTLELTTTAPDGTYLVEVYLDDATEPAASVNFAVGEDAAKSDAVSADYTLYSQSEGGFSIQYPSDWIVTEVKESKVAAFYPQEYAIADENDVNAVVVIALPGSAKGYTLDSAMESWVSQTVDEKLENYVNVSQTTSTVNGNDVSVFEYSWSRDGYDLYTIDFLLVSGENLYVITFTATQKVVDLLYPYVEQMVLTFNIL